MSFLRDAAEMPVLAEVNALGKVIPREAKEPAPQDGLPKALDIIEIDSLSKTSAKAKNGFVPGREGMSARTVVLGRSRRTGGVRSVITSYSIHYTKLYDSGFRSFGLKPGL